MEQVTYKANVVYAIRTGVLLICSLLNCILWSDYGLIGDKFQVYFANGIGACITLIFVSIYLVYLAKKNLFMSCAYITFLCN